MQYQTNTLEHHWMPFTANRDFKADPRLVVKGAGMYYTDHKGGRVIDGASGLFCCAAGHGRQEIADAVAKQLMEIDYSLMISTTCFLPIPDRKASTPL